MPTGRSKKLAEDHTKPFFLAVGFVRPHAPFTAPREFFDLYDLETVQTPNVPRRRDVGHSTDGKIHQLRPTEGWRPPCRGQLERHLLEANWCLATWPVFRLWMPRLARSSKHWKTASTETIRWSFCGLTTVSTSVKRTIGAKQTLWEEATKVPLFFKDAWPRLRPVGKCSQVVSLLDIYPTLVDLCELPPASRLEGASLVPLLRDPSTTREQTGAVELVLRQLCGPK